MFYTESGLTFEGLRLKEAVPTGGKLACFGWTRRITYSALSTAHLHCLHAGDRSFQ